MYKPAKTLLAFIINIILVFVQRWQLAQDVRQWKICLVRWHKGRQFFLLLYYPFGDTFNRQLYNLKLFSSHRIWWWSKYQLCQLFQTFIRLKLIWYPCVICSPVVVLFLASFGWYKRFIYIGNNATNQEIIGLFISMTICAHFALILIHDKRVLYSVHTLKWD